MDTLENTLSRLLIESRSGDGHSYTQLFREAENWLKYYFLGRISSSCKEDLIQETLLSMHVAEASYDSDRPFLPWLATIARYKWIDQLRKDYRSNSQEFCEEHIEPETSDEIYSKVSLQKMMKSIPQKQSQAIFFTKIVGYSVVETSLLTGQSESSVKTNVHRGLKRMSAFH